VFVFVCGGCGQFWHRIFFRRLSSKKHFGESVQMDHNQGHQLPDRQDTRRQPIGLDWGQRTPWILRILVACRVSVVSVIAGVLLFLLSTQARDLFADTAFGALPWSLRAWGF
jgi:hypothetical protein